MNYAVEMVSSPLGRWWFDELSEAIEFCRDTAPPAVVIDRSQNVLYHNKKGRCHDTRPIPQANGIVESLHAHARRDPTGQDVTRLDVTRQDST